MEHASASATAGRRRPPQKNSIGLRGAVSAVIAVSAGFALRAWMLHKFSQINGDALIYGGLGKNLLQHGQFAISDSSGALQPTLIRLPGYPLFLAVCFRIFGMENYTAVMWVQVLLDLAGCLLIADFVRRATTAAAGQCALWMAVLCPFTAVYTAAPLTETTTLFAIALALWSAGRFREEPGWANALLFTAAVTFAALLRPDGALLAVALAPAMAMSWRRETSTAESTASKGRGAQTARVRRMAIVCLLLALAPFAIWTGRNWRVFHVVEPLAPRYATDPGEDIYPGWQRWVKTWCLDFVSTYDVYWPVPGSPLDLSKLPSRAFDTPAQYAETAALAADYNRELDIVPDIDARFARLADERIAAHPLRYYVGLPLGRVADMWLRPRVENLPIDLDWWVYANHYSETRFSWFYAALNTFYILLGIGGLCLRPRFWASIAAYMLLRSALLSTIEAPEARYTLECFPFLFAMGGIALYRFTYWVFLSVSRAKAEAGSG